MGAKVVKYDENTKSHSTQKVRTDEKNADIQKEHADA